MSNNLASKLLRLRRPLKNANKGRDIVYLFLIGALLLALFVIAVSAVSGIVTAVCQLAGIDFNLIEWIKSKGINTVIVWIFVPLTVVMAVGLGAVVLHSISQTLWYAWKSRNWPTAFGVVQDVEINGYSGEGDGYVVNVRYSYAIPGAEHCVGERFAFGRETPWFQFRTSAERFVAEKCQKGNTVTVHYDPGEPTRAVLEPGLKMDPLLAVLVLSCLGLLVYGLLKMISP